MKKGWPVPGGLDCRHYGRGSGKAPIPDGAWLDERKLS